MGQRMRRWLLLIALSMGCRTPKPLNTVRMTVDTVQQQTGVPVIGPVTWMHHAGLTIDIPEGWNGIENAEEALLVSDGVTRISLRVAYPVSGVVQQCGRVDWEPLRVGATKSRAFPRLGPVDSWSATSPDSRGASMDCWLIDGPHGSYLLAVEFPFGGSVAGRSVVKPLLATLRLTEEAVPKVLQP